MRILFPTAAAAVLLGFGSAASAATLIDYNVYAAGNAFISGGSYGAIASGSFTNANGAGGTNFASRTGSTSALTGDAFAASSRLSGLASTGTISTVQYQPGNMILTGQSDGINVFNIAASQFSQLYRLSFAGSGTGAIVNIVGGGAFSNYVDLQFGNLATSNVIFNFADASSVELGGWTVGGSILAPNALVKVQGGTVRGSVIAGRFHSEGATIGGTGFAGLAQTPGAVPEPATWAMMIAGFGLVGWAMRRRRAVGTPVLA